MAAPLGFKTFNTGDVLSAADTNGYLMQGVLVFADAAARTAAITSPQEGQTSYLKDTDVIQVYSGSAWVTKSGGSSPLTTKGDLYTFGTGDTRLAVGTNGHTLVADSSTATGLAWATPAGGAGSLTKITSASFTTQSSVAVDDVFTSTYKTYYVFWSCSASVDGADLQMQFRYAGPNTQATDYYGAGFGYDRSNTLSTYGFSNTTQATIYNALVDAGSLSFGNITFDDVGNASAQAKYFGNGFGRTTQTVINYAGFQNTSRTYTGFLLKPDSGTITGRYQVYGLEN